MTINFDCNVKEKELQEIENDKNNGNVSGTFEMMSLIVDPVDTQIELSDSKYVILTLHWVTG